MFYLLEMDVRKGFKVVKSARGKRVTKSAGSIRYVCFDSHFLEKSWGWLNDPEIRALTDTPLLTRDQQKQWFQSLDGRPDYRIWGVQRDNEPIGAVGIKSVTTTDGEYWGYIGEKAYWGKGIGRQMLDAMEEKAIGLHLSSLWLRVLRSNQRAIRLYVGCGYIEERIEDALLIMRKSLPRSWS